MSNILWSTWKQVSCFPNFFLLRFHFFSLFPATRKISLQLCLFLPFVYRGSGKKQSMDILQSGFTYTCLLGPFGPFDPLVFLVLLSGCSAVWLHFQLSSLRPRRLIQGRGEGGQGSGREHLEDASFIQSYPPLRINPTKGQPNQWLPKKESWTKFVNFKIFFSIRGQSGQPWQRSVGAV